ncbi:MAG TPA: YlxR family protein [Actinomycetota bacterium]|nr:YlxR family protein [Actinomycetota bacterium]
MDAGPLRTCVGCRSVRPQKDLMRVGRRSDGTLSTAAHAEGRGAYLCRDAACVEAAFDSGRLRRALRVGALPEGLKEVLMRKGVDG